MKSIENITQYTTIIKKSEFITTLIPCNEIEQVESLVAKYSKSDATHNCVAYIVNNHEKANDDGEPSGTAGLPMLNVLQRQGLENIIFLNNKQLEDLNISISELYGLSDFFINVSLAVSGVSNVGNILSPNNIEFKSVDFPALTSPQTATVKGAFFRLINSSFKESFVIERSPEHV